MNLKGLKEDKVFPLSLAPVYSNRLQTLYLLVVKTGNNLPPIIQNAK